MAKFKVAAIFTAYTGIEFGDWADSTEYMEHILGRTILTHEYGSDAVWKEAKEKSKVHFLLCASQLKDKTFTVYE